MKKKSGNFADKVPHRLAKKSFLNDSLNFVIGEEKNSGNSKIVLIEILPGSGLLWKRKRQGS
jgi:hypothetical protein